VKISYLSYSPVNTHVANAVHVMNMCSSMAHDGHSVVLHARCRKEDSYTKLFQLYGVKNKFAISAFEAGKIPIISPLVYGLIQALRVKFIIKPDICYARCLISALFVMYFGFKTVLEFHEMPHNKLLKLLYKILLNHKYLLRVVVISKGLLHDLQFNFCKINNNIEWLVAHDGANIPYSNAGFPLKNGNGCRIGYTGGLRSGNGLQLILDMAYSFPEHSFHIVGGNEDDVIFWKSKQKSTNVFWYGVQAPCLIENFLNSMDILLAPYQYGPKTGSGRDTYRWMSPLKIFEYMASGKPMIVSDFPVLREVLNDKISMLVNPDDFLKWCEVIKQLIDNEQVRKEIGSFAFAEFVTNYTWQVRVKKVLAGIV